MSSEIDDIVEAFYAAFDNRRGRRPAANELRALLLPKARITRVSRAGVESWSVDEFIAPRIAMLTDGTLTEFHEWEVESSTTTLGNMASRYSLYEKSGTLSGQAYAGQGRKIIHLCRLDEQWRISAVLWEDA